MNEEVKGFLFDYGGTLDNEGDHWAVTIREAYGAAGMCDIPLDHFKAAYVHGERELARTRHILPHHTFGDTMLIKARIELEYLRRNGYTLDDAEINRAAEIIADYCDKRARSCTAAAAKVLEELSKRYTMALVSNFYGNIETILADYGLAGLFPEVIESAVVGVRKPDPRIFALGVEALHLRPEQTVVVGDSISKDIQPALSLGCDAVWIEGRPWFDEKASQNYPEKIQALPELLEM